jgi:radical SAM protein with 4Fe4S-binding SPASM domain
MGDARINVMDDLREYSFYFQRPAKVQLDLTDKCNLDCLYCYNKASTLASQGKMTDPEVAFVLDKICSQLNPVVVTFSGGEPLLRRKLLWRCIQQLKEHEVEAWINTNGLLISRDDAEVFHRLGVDNISVNIESLTPSVHDQLRGAKGAFGSLPRVLDLLKDSVGAEKISIACVVNRENMESLPELAKFVQSQGFRELHLLDMIPTVGGDHSLIPTREEWRRFYVIFQEVRGTGVRINPNHALLFQSGFDKDHVFPFCMAGRVKMVICANGDIVPCNYFKHPEYVCGNALRDDLLAVWTEAPVMQRFRYSLDGYESCVDCTSLKKCAGGCKALSLALSGEAYRPDPYCREYTLRDIS